MKFEKQTNLKNFPAKTEKSKGIVITGGAGFIGSNLIKAFNDRGFDDIIIVDILGEKDKWKNIRGLRFKLLLNPNEFGRLATENDLVDIDTVIHLGANTDTTDKDADAMIVNNCSFSRSLYEICKETDTRLIYASSAATYGDGSNGYDDKKNTFTYSGNPLNVYAYSKQLLDESIFPNGDHEEGDTVGLKFFNVFGQNEKHKGHMQSVVTTLIDRVRTTNEAVLFKSHNQEYKDGEFVRDFIYVRDVVNIILKFYDNKSVNGLYNVGTGNPRSWNDLANSVFSALGKPPIIKYIDMPDNIRDQYQYYTCATTEKLKEVIGNDYKFWKLEDAIKDYIENA